MPKNKSAIASDLKRLDAHVVQPHEYEDMPEWTEEELAAADLNEGGKLIRRGRPPSPETRKLAVKLRLDPDLVHELRASGPGWQTRVNKLLREVVLRPDVKPGSRYVRRLPGVRITAKKMQRHELRKEEVTRRRRAAKKRPAAKVRA